MVGRGKSEAGRQEGRKDRQTRLSKCAFESPPKRSRPTQNNNTHSRACTCIGKNKTSQRQPSKLAQSTAFIIVVVAAQRNVTCDAGAFVVAVIVGGAAALEIGAVLIDFGVPTGLIGVLRL